MPNNLMRIDSSKETIGKIDLMTAPSEIYSFGSMFSVQITMILKRKLWKNLIIN